MLQKTLCKITRFETEINCSLCAAVLFVNRFVCGIHYKQYEEQSRSGELFTNLRVVGINPLCFRESKWFWCHMQRRKRQKCRLVSVYNAFFSLSFSHFKAKEKNIANQWQNNNNNNDKMIFLSRPAMIDLLSIFVPFRFYLYKLPGQFAESLAQKHTRYVYITSAAPSDQWTLSKYTLNDSASMAAQTLAQAFYDRTNDVQDRLLIAYNDEPPIGPSSSNKGHTKGVLVADAKSGFWLVHSVPLYPNISSKYGRPTGDILPFSVNW